MTPSLVRRLLGGSPRRVRGRMAFALGLMLLGGLWPLATFLSESSSHTSLSVGGVAIELSLAPLVWVGCAFPFLLLGFVGSRSGLSLPRRSGLLVLRTFFLVLVALGVGDLSIVRPSEKLCVRAVLDRSESLGDEAFSSQSELLANLERARPESGRLSVVGFAERAVLTSPTEVASEGHRLNEKVRNQATNIERALALAAAAGASDCGVRTLVVSDGRATRGDVLPEVAALAERGVETHVFPLESAVVDDLVVRSLRVPDEVRRGEPFFAEVTVRAPKLLDARLELLDGEGRVAAVEELAAFSGEKVVRLQASARLRGEQQWTVRGIRKGVDAFAENDVAVAGLRVVAPPRVLLVDSVPSALRPLRSALEVQGFEVETRSPAGLPTSAEELGDYDFVVLSDTPRSSVPSRSEEALVRYAATGKTLLFVGGEASFGPGGWEGSRLEKILPLRSASELEKESAGVALALVIDRSGSMAGLPLEMAKQACEESVSLLSAADLVTVIAFDSRPMRAVPLGRVRSKEKMRRDILRIQPGGGTEIFSALDAAYQDLAVAEARRKHIVLLTDGNSGADGLTDLAATAFSAGISVTTVGFGTGVNEELLASLANAGGGRFHRVDDAMHLPRIFTRETEGLFEATAAPSPERIVAPRPRDFLRGVRLERAPPLFGKNAVELAGGADVLLALDSGEPLLAERTHGRGRVLAWASDLKGNYAREFLGFADLPRLLAQLLRRFEPDREKDSTPTLEVDDDGKTLSLRFDLAELGLPLGESIEATASVKSFSGDGAPTVGSFSRELPGLYRARLPRVGTGLLAIEVEYRFDGGERVVRASSFASAGYPEELDFQRGTPAEFLELARVGRGRVRPTPAQLWQPHPASPLEREPLALPLWFAALAVFSVDLLLRRLLVPRAPVGERV